MLYPPNQSGTFTGIIYVADFSKKTNIIENQKNQNPCDF